MKNWPKISNASYNTHAGRYRYQVMLIAIFRDEVGYQSTEDRDSLCLIEWMSEVRSTGSDAQ